MAFVSLTLTLNSPLAAREGSMSDLDGFGAEGGSQRMRRHVSRRSLLRGTLALAGMTVLAACGQQPAPAAPPATAAPPPPTSGAAPAGKPTESAAKPAEAAKPAAPAAAPAAPTAAA